MVIICGQSAWAWWRTPPIVRETTITSDMLNSYGSQEVSRTTMRHLLAGSRRSASEATRLVSSRLLDTLKGVPTPVHVMVEDYSTRTHSQLLRQHRIPSSLPREHLYPLGNELYVASPVIALTGMARQLFLEQLITLAFEACGLYALFAPTHRARLALKGLEAEGLLSPAQCHQQANAYCDLRGNAIPLCDSSGRPLPWSPCRNRRGTLTSLWKRPPLISSEDLLASAARLADMHGLPALRRAAQFILDGSGSPLETQWIILTCLPPRLGGEGWDRPLLNCRLDFSPEVKELAGMPYCICDIIWPALKSIIEVNGFDYHADDMGFYVASNRHPALEAMGYTVQEVNHSQMSKLELLDVILSVCARRLDLPLQKRTSSFLNRRELLHSRLFRIRQP